MTTGWKKEVCDAKLVPSVLTRLVWTFLVPDRAWPPAASQHGNTPLSSGSNDAVESCGEQSIPATLPLAAGCLCTRGILVGRHFWSDQSFSYNTVPLSLRWHLRLCVRVLQPAASAAISTRLLPPPTHFALPRPVRSAPIVTQRRHRTVTCEHLN